MNTLKDILPTSRSLDTLFASKDLQKIIADSLLDPLSEFLTRPAKNIRAKLVEIGYRLSLSEDPDEISEEVRNTLKKGSAIVELIHNGSLIVDDIQDSSFIRRNRPALHIVHGVPVALNAGNWLYFWALSHIKSLSLLSEIQQELTDDILSMMMKAHAGQALDVGTSIDQVLKKNVRETCLASMELKTGTLMSLALRIGAGIAGKKWKKHELIHLGMNMGTLLQMYDDIGNFFHDVPKRYEDVKLRRPTWIWAVASGGNDYEYESFIEAINLLPDETLLQRWTRKNYFRRKVQDETYMFRVLSEAAWKSEWQKTHKVSLRVLLDIMQKLEKSYV